MEIGSQVGPYRIEALIGQGGMAQVYRALHVGLNHHHALKVLPLAMTADKTLVARFLAEAQKMARLQHPNILTVHTVSEADAVQPYFAMDMVEGGDLADMIAAKGTFTLEEALPILRQIAAALDYAHGRGLIHRDVKPGNILLQPDHHDCSGVQLQQGHYMVQMTDFGIAHAQEENDGKRLTKTGMIVGTPEYMSPEQGGSGAPVDHRSDLYSLAIIAYEMLCGRPPFQLSEGTSLISVLMSQVRDAPVPLSQLVPGVPPSANAAILRALEKDPARRFDSCGQFVEAFFHYVPVEQSSFSSNIPTASKPGFPWKSAVLSGLLVLALSAGVGLMAYVSLKPGHSEPTVEIPPPGEFVLVPDLVGKSEDQARQILLDRNLVPDVNTDFSNAFERQTVMAQTPGVNEQLPGGATVSIRVSLGAKANRPVAVATSTPIVQPSAVAVAPRSQWVTYTNSRRRWSLSYPPGWTVEEKYYSSDDRDRVTFKAPYPHVFFVVDASPEVQTPPLESWLDMDRRFVKAHKEHYRKISIYATPFAGYEGARWEYLLQRKNEPMLRHINRGTHVAGDGYAMRFSALPSEFLRWEPTFSQIYLSFSFAQG